MTDSRLTRALTPQDGDFDHPNHDVLVAYVDARTDAADIEWVEAHLEVCGMCRDDVDDLRDVQRQLRTAAVAAPALRASGTRRDAVYVSVAAALVLLAWLGGGFKSASPNPESVRVATAPVPSVEPPPPSLPSPSALSEVDQQMVTRAVNQGHPSWPAFHEIVRSRAGTLLGDTPAVEPLTPVSPIATAVTTARPEFAWTVSEGTTSYEVAIYDEAFNQVATSGSLSQSRWHPDVDLPRDRILSWQITAVGPSGTIVSPAPPQPEARFVVLSESAVANVNVARTRLASEPLALGIALAEAGLYRDAEAALTRAASDPRYDATTVRRLLAALRR